MNRGLKITLIVVGSLVVAGGVTLGVVLRSKKKKKEKEDLIKELEETKKLEEINKGLDVQQSTVVAPNVQTKVIPIRNLDKVINNSFAEIKGVTLYPASKSNNAESGHPYAEGFANIRETAEVNNSLGFLYDFGYTNLLGKVNAGTPIGTIYSEQYDNMTPKMRWFKVKLTKKLGGKEYGYVRGDNVTFKGFPKKGTKSSFDGNMVERYNTSYQLGAEVFPHSGWNINSNTVNADMFENFDAKELDINL
jgi:hypothetical protein